MTIFASNKITNRMENLKIDRTKLMTFKSYAKAYGYSVQRIYQLEKEKKIDVVMIDGVRFARV